MVHPWKHFTRVKEAEHRGHRIPFTKFHKYYILKIGKPIGTENTLAVTSSFVCRPQMNIEAVAAASWQAVQLHSREQVPVCESLHLGWWPLLLKKLHGQKSSRLSLIGPRMNEEGLIIGIVLQWTNKYSLCQRKRCSDCNSLAFKIQDETCVLPCQGLRRRLPKSPAKPGNK